MKNMMAIVFISVLMLSVVSAEIYGEADSNAGLNLGSNVNVDSNIDITVSGGSQVVVLSDGNEAVIKITVDDARRRSEASLEVEDCSNCSVELKEERIDGQAYLVYDVEAKRETKMFGVFKKNMNVSSKVDAETGTVVSVDKPWWSFMTVESNTGVNSNTNAAYG